MCLKDGLFNDWVQTVIAAPFESDDMDKERRLAGHR